MYYVKILLEFLQIFGRPSKNYLDVVSLSLEYGNDNDTVQNNRNCTIFCLNLFRVANSQGLSLEEYSICITVNFKSQFIYKYIERG